MPAHYVVVILGFRRWPWCIAGPWLPAKFETSSRRLWRRSIPSLTTIGVLGQDEALLPAPNNRPLIKV